MLDVTCIHVGEETHDILTLAARENLGFTMIVPIPNAFRIQFLGWD